MLLSRTRRAGEKISVAGLEPNALKKLNGDKLGTPFLSIVLANAIGRGAILPSMNAWSFAVEISFGSIRIIIIYRRVAEPRSFFY